MGVKVDKKTWALHYGFNHDDMKEIETGVKKVAGKIVAIVDNPLRECLRPPTSFFVGEGAD